MPLASHLALYSAHTQISFGARTLTSNPNRWKTVVALMLHGGVRYPFFTQNYGAEPPPWKSTPNCLAPP